MLIPTIWVTNRSTLSHPVHFPQTYQYNLTTKSSYFSPPFAPTHWRRHFSIVPDCRRWGNEGLSASRRSLPRRRRCRRRRRVRVLGAARHGAPEAELPHRRQPGKGAAGREVKIKSIRWRAAIRRRSQPLKSKSNFNLKYCTQ